MTNKKENGSRRVKGELIVAVIGEIVAAGRIKELLKFVEKEKIDAVIDIKSVGLLKAFLKSEISANQSASFNAVMQAESSDPPCQPG